MCKYLPILHFISMLLLILINGSVHMRVKKSVTNVKKIQWK